MRIAFDTEVADALVRVLHGVDEALRSQGWGYQLAAEAAFAEFRGAYARLVEACRTQEVTDRGRLVGKLYDLSEQVLEAKRLAERENDRLEALAAWEAREEVRDRQRRQDFLAGVAAGIEDVFDPKPSEWMILPPTISAAFQPAQRVRTSHGAADQVSSADPTQLRGFVSVARSADRATEDMLSTVRDAWARFRGRCSWVPLGNTSFLDGFGRLLDENRVDADWIESIAAAFEQAGSGSLTNRVLDLAVLPLVFAPGDDPVTMLEQMDPDAARAWLLAHPGVLSSLTTIPPEWGTASSVFAVLVGIQRERGVDPVRYADLLQRMYLTRAAERSGIDLATWNTGKGAAAVRDQVTGSYEYYASLFVSNPDFSWAGMANLVGPDFAGGFLDLHSFRDHVAQLSPAGRSPLGPMQDVLAKMTDGEIAFYEKTFLDMQKNIFFDAATMHEAYLERGLDGIDELYAAGLLRADDTSRDPEQAQLNAQKAWQAIDKGIQTGNQTLIDQGNEALLRREQYDIIQKSYDNMYRHAPTGEAFTYVLGVVGDASIPGTRTLGQYDGGISVPLDYLPAIPGVQGQIETWYLPTENISNFKVRWDYIEHDTLPAWQQLAHDHPDEATRLVQESVADRIDSRRFDNRIGEVLDDLHDTEWVWQ